MKLRTSGNCYGRGKKEILADFDLQQEKGKITHWISSRPFGDRRELTYKETRRDPLGKNFRLEKAAAAALLIA